jgi:rod shape-determining protein MreC
MESFFTRYRNLVVLLVVVVAQMVGLAVQVRRNTSGQSTLNTKDQSGVRLIRLWANAIVSPPEEAIHFMKMGAIGLWENYIDLRGVKKKNRQLEKTIGRLRLEQAELLEDARQGERLEALLKFQENYVYKTLPAQVYGTSGSLGSHVFYIDKGSADGLKRDMAVITPDGIVGKLQDVFPHSAQVLAINDQTSGAGVILMPTRIRGILEGNASGQLEVVGVLADERIKPGAQVLTAGDDMIFPRGLPVGVVEKIAPDPERVGFVYVMVKPAAHLNRLDEVLVITSTKPYFSAQAKQDIATSQALDGTKAASLSAQQRNALINAEDLPTLLEPNVPADKQPLFDSAPAALPPQPPQPVHPDIFSPPATAQGGNAGQAAGTGPEQGAPAPITNAAGNGTGKTGAQAVPRRHR